MAPESVQKSTNISFLMFVIALVITLGLAIWVFPHVFSRYYYQQAVMNFRNGKFTEAEQQIDLAEQWLPSASFAGDRKSVALVKGDLLFRKGSTSRRIVDFLENMELAEELYRQVLDIEPLDIDAYTSLARVTSGLERVYPFVKKVQYPKKALPIFRHLLVLMPTNLYSHTLFTRYLSRNKMDVELNRIIFQSITLYPPLVKQLRKQPFYSTSMDTMIEKALLAAIQKDIFVKKANRELSDLAYRASDYKKAIEFFRRSIPLSSRKDLSVDFLQLGRLYLKNGQFKKSEQAFIRALRAGNCTKYLKRIWFFYRSEKQFELFLQFLKTVEKQYRLSAVVEIVRAKCFMAMGHLGLAREHLLKITSAGYLPEGFYLQAKISELQKDWDAMELQSQRATVLDSDNPVYYILFSKALQRQKKWKQAENASTKAIMCSATKKPRFYNHRAWIKWQRNDLPGAICDWEEAVAVSPKSFRFYYNMALAYEKRGNIPAALKHLDKALKLNPNNKKVYSLYLKLSGKVTL
jgi:tetratricopeptide (TPR) repeat protein